MREMLITDELGELIRRVDMMLREQDMHESQHRDGLIFGQVPGTESFGIYNRSLLFANKRDRAVSRRYASVYMTLRNHTEGEAVKHGWVSSPTQEPVFLPQIKYGPLYAGMAHALNLEQVAKQLQHQRQTLWDMIRQSLHFTPRQDTISTFFALQMVSSSPDTNWHIPSLTLDQRMQPYLISGVHAPLIFTALAETKLGTNSYRHNPNINQPLARVTVREAKEMDDITLSMVFDLLNIHLFDVD